MRNLETGMLHSPIHSRTSYWGVARSKFSW